MAAAFVRAHTPSAFRGTTTVTPVTFNLDSEVPAGNTIVLALGTDNTGFGGVVGPNVSSIGKGLGETNSWTLVQAGDITAGAAAATASRVQVWAITTTVAWPAITYTFRLGTAVAAATLLILEFSGLDGTVRSGGLGLASAGGTITDSLSTISTGDLVLGAAAWEHNTSGSDDTSTTNGAWSAGQATVTTGGGNSMTHIGIRAQWKILTGSSPTSWTAAGTSDISYALMAFVPTGSGGGPTGLPAVDKVYYGTSLVDRIYAGTTLLYQG